MDINSVGDNLFMGERIKDLSKTRIRGKNITIELNESQTSYGDYDIHIEAPMFRFAMRDDEFMKFAYNIMEAKRKLINTKEIRGE